jgi:hypothetical protein
MDLEPLRPADVIRRRAEAPLLRHDAEDRRGAKEGERVDVCLRADCDRQAGHCAT